MTDRKEESRDVSGGKINFKALAKKITLHFTIFPDGQDCKMVEKVLRSIATRVEDATIQRVHCICQYCPTDHVRLYSLPEGSKENGDRKA